MKKMSLALLMFCGALPQAQAQTPVYNQTTLQPSSNFYISGTGQSGTIKTNIGTSSSGTAHFLMYNGDGNTAANLRWTQAFIGTEGASNAGSDFRIFRYSNTGTFLGTGLAIERATGNITVNQLTAANGSRILGTGTTANSSYLQFMQSDNVTRDGYIGMGTTANKDLYVVSDGGNVNLVPKAGGGMLQVCQSQIVNTTGGLLLSNATSNNISFNTVGLGKPSYTTRSAGSKVILWNSPLSATASGWDIGMENEHIWFGTPAQNYAQGFKFYGGTAQIGRIDAVGNSQWEGQGRFKGWLVGTAATGAGAELGVSAGNVNLLGYNRTTNAYIPVILTGGTTSTNQTVVTIREGGVAIAAGAPSTPLSLLSVKGTITAQKVKVTQTGWADYVFHKDYQLPPLLEVERYVNTHQHLEGIPSAAEVEKEGIDVGEMNKKLLAKVEELTLYLIEQNKKIMALEDWKKQVEKKQAEKQ